MKKKSYFYEIMNKEMQFRIGDESTEGVSPRNTSPVRTPMEGYFQ